MVGRLDGKKALVTGATSNIGRAIAIAFAAEGAHVVVAGRDRVRGLQVVEAIRTKGGNATFVAVDLDGTPAVSARLAAEASDALDGTIDILVNNAGIFPASTTFATSADEFDRVFAVNVKAPFFLTSQVVPSMIEQGSGVVINLGSWVARLGVPVGALYSSTKGALETLTRAWSAEFGASGIRVNAISPGVVNEPGVSGPGDQLMANTPAGAAGRPEAIAAAAVYLASADGEFVHGAVLDVDGGRTGVALTSFGPA